MLNKFLKTSSFKKDLPKKKYVQPSYFSTNQIIH